MVNSVMLAKNYDKGMKGSRKDKTEFSKPPEGWVASEKYDGYRALFYYDENGNPVFESRAGKPFKAPEIFLSAKKHRRVCSYLAPSIYYRTGSSRKCYWRHDDLTFLELHSGGHRFFRNGSRRL